MGGVLSGGEIDKKDLPYPAKHRSFLKCTIDPACLFMFGATVAFWLILSFEAFSAGHTPMMLLTGQDYKGDYCGTGDYKDMDYVYYTLDPNSPCLIWPGLPILDSSGAESDAEWKDESLGLHTKCNDELITIPSDANLVTEIDDLLKDLDVNFRKVCVTECPTYAAQGNTEGHAGGSVTNTGYTAEELTMREFAPLINGTTYPSAWTAPDDNYESAAYPYKWKALPSAICPYEADFCASPWDDAVVVEVENSYFCLPTAAYTLSLQVSAGDITQDLADQAVANSITDFSADISAGFKDFIADCAKSWPMFLYVFGIAVVVGLAWMIVLRFSLDIWIWIGIVAFGLLLGVGGFAMMFKAGECYDPVVGQQDQLAEIASTVEGGVNTDVALGLANTASDNLSQAWNGCPDKMNYTVTDNNLRLILLYGACVVWGLAGLYLLCILCSCKAIYMGIKVTKCAARFVFHNRMILLVPIIQIAFLAVVLSVWIICQMFLFVDPAIGFALDEADTTNRADAIYKCDAEGQSAYCAEVTPFETGRAIGNSCVYACAPGAVSMASWKFWWGIFAGFWIICLIIATCQMIIAFACSFWFFKKDNGCGTGFWWTFRYHLGTLAFGSVIVAALKTFRAWISYQQAMVKATTGGGESPANKAMEIMCCAGQCCLWCIEKCIKFLNKNAYIYVALKAEAFCTAAKNVFQLIVANVRRVAWLAMISGMVVMLSVAAITAGVATSGYFLLMALYPPVSADMTDEDKKTAVSGALGPTIVYGLIGYIVAKLYMTVYAMATSTILVCAIEAETLDIKGTEFDDDEKLQEIYAQAKEDSRATKGGMENPNIDPQ